MRLRAIPELVRERHPPGSYSRGASLWSTCPRRHVTRDSIQADSKAYERGRYRVYAALKS